MKTSFRIRNGCITLSHALNPTGPNPKSKIVPPILKITKTSVLSASFFNPHIINRNTATRLCCSMAEVSVAKQFESFNLQLQESCALRERIRSVAVEIESVTGFMHACLLHVHQSRPLPKILDEANAQIDVLRGLYRQLAEIIRECPGQYYRYHGYWRSETETVVSLLAFMHWLETGNLLLHTEADEKLGLNESEFGLDVEEYLVGICFMSNELPRYVVNRVTAGDYDCPRKVLEFLTDLHTAFRMLNLRNDFLRRKFDGMKYDLKKVEEVYYDVKIRGLAAATNSAGEQVQS